MKNPAPYIREKLVALLNETIIYEGVAVPCYEGDGEITSYQIILQGQVKRNKGTRDSFAWQCEQRIEIISEQPTNIHKHVDAIAEGVLGILKPTPSTSPFTGSPDFQVLNVEVNIDDYKDELSGESSYINRLPLDINFLVTQIHNN